jgi:excisionase family DNA binding protein
MNVRSISQRAVATLRLRAGCEQVSVKLPTIFEEFEATCAGLQASELPAVLGELERVKALLTARLSAPPPPSEPDRLLTVEQAAERLALAADTLYRKAKAFPFTVRLPGRQVRFSEAGIDRFIRSKQGR